MYIIQIKYIISTEKIDNDFITNNFKDKYFFTKQKSKYNTSTLSFIEFISVLIFMSKQSEAINSYTDALFVLLKKLFSKVELNISMFRLNEIWVNSIDDLLKSNLNEIERFYKTYSNSSNQKQIDFREAIDLFTQVIPIQNEAQNIICCFGFSKRLSIKIIEDNNFLKYLTFDEFIEFIIRISKNNRIKQKETLRNSFDRTLNKIVSHIKGIKFPPINQENLQKENF